MKSNNSNAVPEEYFSSAEANIIICPFCLKKDPPIVSIQSEAPLQQVSMDIKCPCLEGNLDFSSNINLEKYFLFLSELKRRQCNDNFKNQYCFKHPDKASCGFCKNCQLYMCNFCMSYHSDFEPGHQIETGKDFGDYNKCPQHPNKESEFYCLTCGRNVCSDCYAQGENQHNLVNLKDYWKNVYDRLRFKNIEELYDFISKENSSFHYFLTEEIKRIDQIIIVFENFKQNLIQEKLRSEENNNNLKKLLCGVYYSFLQSKQHPSFAAISNLDRIKMSELLPQRKRFELFDIIDAIQENLLYLNEAQASTIGRTIISFRGNENVEEARRLQNYYLNYQNATPGYPGQILQNKKYREEVEYPYHSETKVGNVYFDPSQIQENIPNPINSQQKIIPNQKISNEPTKTLYKSKEVNAKVTKNKENNTKNSIQKNSNNESTPPKNNDLEIGICEDSFSHDLKPVTKKADPSGNPSKEANVLTTTESTKKSLETFKNVNDGKLKKPSQINEKYNFTTAEAEEEGIEFFNKIFGNTLHSTSALGTQEQMNNYLVEANALNTVEGVPNTTMNNDLFSIEINHVDDSSSQDI